MNANEIPTALLNLSTTELDCVGVIMSRYSVGPIMAYAIMTGTLVA